VHVLLCANPDTLPRALHRLYALAAALSLALSGGARDTVAQRGIELPPREFWWGAGAALAGAAASDAALARWTERHRSQDLDHAADVGDALGSGRYLIAGMAATYIGARLARRAPLARAVTRVAVAYTIANIQEGVLKPLVGRHRPLESDDPWRFRPLSSGDEWHSLPSAHATHAFTIAAAVSEEARRPWVSTVAYGAATLVAWSRVYDRKHWTSDVTAGAVIGIATSHTTLRWFRRRPPH
jgi:membrane-associated phospholipid phosphatase